MPLRNDLLTPIPGDNPAGANLRYAPVVDKIKEARREDDEGPQGVWQHERKLADWATVVKLSAETIATKSKDLQLAAWLAEAQLRREGIAGFREALQLIEGLLENFWDTLYPELEDGDAEMRATPLQWVGDRLEMAVKRISLTKSKLDWNKYKESRVVPSEEAANESDQNRNKRTAAMADGKTTPEEFDSAFGDTPKKFYVDLLATFDETLQTVSALSDACEAKFGGSAPSFTTLTNALNEVRQTVYILLEKKREKEPDDPQPADEVEAEPEPVEEAVEETAASSAPAAAPVRRGGGLPAEPVDRDDAIARVLVAAKYLRAQEPYSPSPYLMLAGLRWGELRAGGETVSAILLEPPPGDARQAIKKLALEGNWTDVLETAQATAGLQCGRGWLDVHRYIARACYELGSWYQPIRQAVITGVAGLLKDYPDLPGMTLMDDTPVANAETVAWLKEEVIPPPAPASAGEAAEQPAYYAQVSVSEEHVAVENAPDPFDLAMKAARSGRAQEGMELLMRELTQERSGRARFLRKSQLAQLCVATNNDSIAFPILQDLASEIERRKLEDWETAEMVAHPLSLLYRCLGKEASPEERQKLYSWICRLDPVQAMNVSK